jgi:NADH-quinone oxidoreductase subunit M
VGILSWIVLVPFITAIAVILLPNKSEHLIKWVSLIGSGIVVILTTIMTCQFWTLYSADLEAIKSTTSTKLYLVERFTWLKDFNIDYYVGVDGISVAMIILTAIIIFCGVLASWNVTNRAKEFFALLLILVAGVFGVFVSFDLFVFFVFYEIAVLPMYLLIAVWGTGKKEYSAMKLTIMLMAGSALLLIGLFAVYFESGLQTFDLIKLGSVDYDSALQVWVFPVFFLGFGVLGALFPFHTWSPDGHASAPTAVSMLHAGVLMKLGGYGAIRVAVYLMPEGAKDWAIFFMVLTTINVIYGALAAIKQKDLKYFTAYSSVSHCGFVLFAVCCLNLLAFKGAVLQMFGHGVMTGLFFALIGMVYGRTKTRTLSEMGGIAKVMPWLATCFYIAGLASLGLPGMTGFVAESHIFLGGFFTNPWIDPTVMRTLTVIATMSIVVTAVYVLRGLGQVFLGQMDVAKYGKLTDATLSEKLATGILVFTIISVGVFPNYLITMIEGPLMPIINKLGH